MQKILIIYSTCEGQTAKIAQRIAATIQTHTDLTAEVCDVAQFDPQRKLDHYAGLVLGGSIHMGKHASELKRFVREHRTQLDSVPTAFYSVSLSAAGDQEQQQDAHRCLHQFLESTEWKPSVTQIVAGALMYQRYGFLKRLFMRLIVSGAGGNTNTTQNHEYTDWNEVEQFTERYLKLLVNDTAKV